MRPLGHLTYHKTSVQAIEFARLNTASHLEDEGDTYSLAELAQRERWLIAGGKDTRVTIWSLISFEKS